MNVASLPLLYFRHVSIVERLIYILYEIFIVSFITAYRHPFIHSAAVLCLEVKYVRFRKRDEGNFQRH